MYLGGLLATDPTEDFDVATSGGVNDFAVRISLEAGDRTMPAKPVIDGDHARPVTGKFPNTTDVVIGPLSYAGLRNYKNSPVRERSLDGGYFYKSGAQLPPDASATITIGDSAAGYAAIVTETGPASGSRSVTYRSCEQPGSTGSWWVGGLRPFRPQHRLRAHHGDRPGQQDNTQDHAVPGSRHLRRLVNIELVNVHEPAAPAPAPATQERSGPPRQRGDTDSGVRI